MAGIDMKKIEKIDKNRNSIQDEVYATYTVFKKNDKKYVQIDTYGRDERKLGAKVSQSIQFDSKSAKFLVNLLSEEFNIK